MSTQPVSPAFVSAADGARLIGISRSGFYAFVKRGILPGPARLGDRALWEVEILLARVKQYQSDDLREAV